MYRITKLSTGEMRLMDPPRYVKQGPNGWAQCEEDETSEFVSVFDLGVCQIWSGDPEEEEGEYPLVILRKDDGLFLNDISRTSKDHTEQIADIEDGAVDLADVVEETTVEVQEAIIEYADVFEALVARVDALEEELAMIKETIN